MDISGKVAVVTGAAQGLGRAYSEALLRQGAKVILSDLSATTGAATETELQEQYGAANVKFVQADVTDKDHMTRVFDAAEEMGPLQILINNAGIGESMGQLKCFQVNTFGVMLCADLATERMRTDTGGPGGVIINISSIAALRALPLGQNYGSSKMAVIGYTRSKGALLGDDVGVRLGVLCPGFVLTPLTEGMKTAEAEGREMPCRQLNIAGGWTPQDTVVEAAMSIIEKPLPQATVVRALSDGAVILKYDEIPTEKL